MDISREIRSEQASKLYQAARSRCAICDAWVYPTEKAHIAGFAQSGPRSGSASSIRRLSGTINSADNLVLLCRNHHHEVDAFSSFWSIKRLRLLKSIHERWWKQFSSPLWQAKWFAAVDKPELRAPDVSVPLAQAVTQASKHNIDEAITLYLSATDEGLRRCDIPSSLAAMLSLSVLLCMRAGSTGTDYGKVCCSRVLDLMPTKSEAMFDVAEWNLAYLRLNDGDLSRPRVDGDIRSRLARRGFFKDRRDHRRLPIPIIIAGEAERCRRQDPSIPRYTPSDRLFFSTRYLIDYLKFSGESRAAADLCFHRRREILGGFDGYAHMISAALQSDERRAAKRFLRLYELADMPATTPMDKLERSFHLSLFKEAVNSGSAFGPTKVAEKVMEPLAKRYHLGSKLLASPRAWVNGIYTEPWNDPIRSWFPDQQSFLDEMVQHG